MQLKLSLNNKSDDLEKVGMRPDEHKKKKNAQYKKKHGIGVDSAGKASKHSDKTRTDGDRQATVTGPVSQKQGGKNETRGQRESAESYQFPSTDEKVLTYIRILE